MLDLRNYTTKEFAEMIDEKFETVYNLMRENDHLGYTINPYTNVIKAVQNSTIKDNNKEIVAKFIYTNLFNRPEHRFYDTKGYTVTLRGC